MPTAARDATELCATQMGMWLQHELHPDSGDYNVVRHLRFDGKLDGDALQAAVQLLATRHDCLRMHPMDLGERVVWSRDDHPVEIVQLRTARDIEDLEGCPFLIPGPMWRVGHLRQQDGAADELVMVWHHLVADLHATDLLMDDLGLLYSCLRSGEPVPALVDTGEYEAAVREALAAEAEDQETDRTWWQAELAGAPSRYPPALTRAPRASRTSLDLVFSPEETRAVEARARRGGTSVGGLLLASVAAVAARWSGESEALVGVPIGRVEFAGVPGLSVTSLPIRIRVEQSGTPGALVRATTGAVAAAMDHATLGMSQLYALPEPLPEVWLWFNDLTSGRTTGSWGDVAWWDDLRPRRVALFPVNVAVTHFQGQIRLHCEAQDASPMMTEHFLAQIKDHVLEGPAARGHDPAPSEPSAVSVWDSICARAETDPQRVACRFTGVGEVTYAALHEAVLQRSAAMQGRVAPGEVVTLVASKSYDHLISLLAARLGRYSLALVDEAWPPLRIDEVLSTYGLGPVPNDAEAYPRANWRRETPGHVMFTSGSSGQPAAVHVPYTTLDAALDRYTRAVGLDESDVVPWINSPSHDPSLRDLLAPLRCGATVVATDIGLLRSAEWATWARSEGVSVLHGSPIMLQLLATSQVSIPTLRLVVSGADTLTRASVELLQAWAPGATIGQVYGCTETPQAVTLELFETDLDGPDIGDLPSVGRALLPGTVFVVNDELGPLPPGQIGRVLVTAPGIAGGYLDAVDREGFLDDWRGRSAYLTADRGWFDDKGSLHLAGRVDRLTKINGNLASLDELEAAALAVPGVTAARATVSRSPSTDLVALYFQAAYPVDAHLVHAAIRRRLPLELIPASIEQVERLEHERGKARAPRSLSPVDLRSDLQLLVDRLAGRAVNENENLMEAGLDSLDLLRVQAFVEAARGEPLPLLTIFRFPTLRSLLRGEPGTTVGLTPLRRTPAHLTHSRSALSRVRTSLSPRRQDV